VHNGICVEVDHAIVAKGRIGLSGFCVDGIKLSVARPEHDLSRSVAIARPVFEPARGRVAGRELIGPDLFAVYRIDGGDARIRSGDVHEPVNHERRNFAGTKSRAKYEAAAMRRWFVAHCSTWALPPWRGFKTWRLHVIHPRYFELAHVFGLDLSKRRKPHSTRIVTVGSPLPCRVDHKAA